MAEILKYHFIFYPIEVNGYIKNIALHTACDNQPSFILTVLRKSKLVIININANQIFIIDNYHHSNYAEFQDLLILYSLMFRAES